jgi:hypothetical protein
LGVKSRGSKMDSSNDEEQGGVEVEEGEPDPDVSAVV